MADREYLRDKLHIANRRLTRQRQLVLEMLEKSADHLDVDGLHRRLKARGTNISVATVYRTLAVLKEMGLVEEHQFGEDHSHFEIAHASPHYHFVCHSCGRVLEFGVSQVMRVARRLSQREGLHITNVHLFVSGYCAECRQDEPKERVQDISRRLAGPRSSREQPGDARAVVNFRSQRGNTHARSDTGNSTP